AVELTLLHDTLLLALREDIGTGDLTSRATISEDARATARYTTKQALVVGGIGVAREIVRLVDPFVEFNILTTDGTSVPTGTPLAEMSGSRRSILTCESTSLTL